MSVIALVVVTGTAVCDLAMLIAVALAQRSLGAGSELASVPLPSPGLASIMGVSSSPVAPPPPPPQPAIASTTRKHLMRSMPGHGSKRDTKRGPHGFARLPGARGPHCQTTSGPERE